LEKPKFFYSFATLIIKRLTLQSDYLTKTFNQGIMKKLFTFLTLLLLIVSAHAQTQKYVVNKANSTHALQGRAYNGAVPKPEHNGGNRAASYSFDIDYDGIDEAYATLNSFDYQRFIWEVNKNFNNGANFTVDYAAVIFDSLINFDATAGTSTYYPLAASTVTLDSFTILFTHEKVSNADDTITFTVFADTAWSVTGTGPAAVLTTPITWDTTIIVSQQIPLNTTNFTVWTIPTNITFPQGHSFGIRVDYAGDTADKFNILAGYRDECADACAGEPTSVGFNSIYYFNYTIATTNTNISGINSIGLDCDQDGTVGTPGACEEFYLQNIVIIPSVTVNADYGVAIQADSVRGCPNTTSINLNANGFGTTALPLTYQWSTTNGNLSSNTDPSVSITWSTDTDPVVSVTVTDANNATATASITIDSRGVNVNITNSDPATLSCGSSLTITSQITGATTGKNYVWSTGQTGATLANISISAPGQYSVTVTNNAGCSATDQVTVQYPGGLNNATGFTVPARLCDDELITFTNTTARLNGWNSTWTYGDGNIGFGVDGQNNYNNPGPYSVKLEVDSAGCKFTSIQNITISSCVGIQETEFSNNISILPNPSNGNINITVNGASENMSIRVYNILGSEVKRFESTDVASTFTKSINLSDLSNGTYLIRIASGSNTAVKRITISK
jgi:hypothetical protein